MAKITPLDRLFITVSQNGITRFISELTGVTSFRDIVNYTREMAPGIIGMTTISVRNSTEGWHTRESIILR